MTARVTLAYVGEPPEAAGWRLAGALAYAPSPAEDDVLAAFDDACAHAAIVMITPAIAALLPPVQLDAALARTLPLVLIEPTPVPPAFDPAERARRQLGVEL